MTQMGTHTRMSHQRHLAAQRFEPVLHSPAPACPVLFCPPQAAVSAPWTGCAETLYSYSALAKRQERKRRVSESHMRFQLKTIILTSLSHPWLPALALPVATLQWSSSWQPPGLLFSSTAPPVCSSPQQGLAPASQHGKGTLLLWHWSPGPHSDICPSEAGTQQCF